jgi:hypothetical protein
MPQTLPGAQLAALPADAVMPPAVLLENSESRFFTSPLLQAGQVTFVAVAVFRTNLSKLSPQL